MGLGRASTPPKPSTASPWLRGALFVVAGLLACASGLVVAVLYVELRLTAPAYALVGPPPHDLHAETVFIPSASGAILHGWFVAGRPGGGAVVLMHGIGSNRLSMVRRARLFNENGLSVLLFDFQAHGESSGTRITLGRLEALDARSAVEFVRRRLPGERIGAIGASLGGAAALLGPAPLPVDALIIEAVYRDIDQALTNRLRITLGPILGGLGAQLLVPVFDMFAPLTIGVRPDQLRPIDHIGEVTVPLLIAAGMNDNRATVPEAWALFGRAREPKSLWLVQGAGHVDLEAYAPGEYRGRILPFLNRLRQNDDRR
jgi:alpha-beta hydrolase superfamily lysophospholipase